MELAIRFSNNSSSGTDGIPYAAWHKAGRQAAVVLQEVVAQIQKYGFHIPSLSTYVNAILLCCLLKNSPALTFNSATTLSPLRLPNALIFETFGERPVCF
jgi:hypothetical protein